jgi:hypothetical protein
MSPTARTHTRNTHGNAPRHLWSTQNRTPGKIPWREARPLPAKHTTHHFRIQRPCFRVHGLGFRGLGAGFGFRVSCEHTAYPATQRQSHRTRWVCACARASKHTHAELWRFSPDWGLASWPRLPTARTSKIHLPFSNARARSTPRHRGAWAQGSEWGG